MKKILILFILTILIGIFFINDVFAASQVTITPVPGSSSPGCETSGGCYSPSIATVDVGGSVIFSNTDTAAHTFTAGTAADGPSGAFDSSLVIAGSSYEWKPTTAGSFPYNCLVHPWMSGLIVVQEAGGNSSYTQSSISVTTDKSKYVNGDVISITGKIVGQSSGIPVSLRVVAPNGNLVTVVILDVNSNNKFSTQLIAGGALMKSGGTYTVTAIYGTENISAETTFTFAGSIGGTPTSPTIQVTGTDFMVNYKITGGKLISITPDVEAHSMIIVLSASQDGTLVITLPRSLIDAKMSSQDDRFFILVNGEEVDFEETATSTDRTLTIHFPTRAQKIEIIGTSVYSNSNNYPQPTPYTPTPSTPVRIPAGMNIIIQSGSSSPGCENSNNCYYPYKFSSGKGSTVTWYNADSAAHTVTSGTPGNGPDGEFDSSLLTSGKSFSHKFNYEGTNPYYCMVHPWMTGYVIVERGGTIIPAPVPTPVPTPTTPGKISVSTDSSQYSPGGLVTIKIYTSQSANVAVSVIGPSGDSLVSRTVSTDSGGYGSLQFKLPDSSQNGSYRVDSTATISGKVSDSTTFSVKSTSSRVSIISLQPTDQQGNAVSSFTKGKLGFVKVILNSDSNVNSLVTINLFDSDLTSLGIGSFKTTLSSGQSEMTISFFIPNDAKIGNGDIYANVFSDWPSQGGVPLTGEATTQVRIQ